MRISDWSSDVCSSDLTLSRVVERAGAVPLRMHYYYGTIFPLVVALRLLRPKRRADGSDLRREPPPVNAALLAICGLARRVMAANRLAGLSVFRLAARRVGKECVSTC